MNLRLFLLIAMTAFFAALWSSDRQYQEAEMLARASAPGDACREDDNRGIAASGDRAAPLPRCFALCGLLLGRGEFRAPRRRNRNGREPVIAPSQFARLWRPRSPRSWRPGP